MYLFQGTPDFISATHKPPKIVTALNLILIQKFWPSDNSVDERGYWEGNSDSENNTTIEIPRAPIPVSAVTCLPEKLGELMAGLYFLLVAKTVKEVVYKEPRKLKSCGAVVGARGILVDKTNRFVHCCVKCRCLNQNRQWRWVHYLFATNSSSLCHNLYQLTFGRNILNLFSKTTEMYTINTVILKGLIFRR